MMYMYFSIVNGGFFKKLATKAKFKINNKAQFTSLNSNILLTVLSGFLGCKVTKVQLFM